MIARTKRLLLRPFAESDVEAMCRVLCDPEVMKFSMGVMAAGDVAAWIEGCVEDYARWGFGLRAVVLKTEGRVVGYCGLTELHIDGQTEIEVGYRLARGVWSRGYATEAATAVRDYGFGVLSLSRLVALVDPDNTASVRVAEKLGMRQEKDVMMPGYDHPDHLYVLNRMKDAD